SDRDLGAVFEALPLELKLKACLVCDRWRSLLKMQRIFQLNFSLNWPIDINYSHFSKHAIDYPIELFRYTTIINKLPQHNWIEMTASRGGDCHQLLEIFDYLFQSLRILIVHANCYLVSI